MKNTIEFRSLMWRDSMREGLKFHLQKGKCPSFLCPLYLSLREEDEE